MKHIFLCLLSAIILAGCAAPRGLPFQEVDIEENRGVVYVYTNERCHGRMSVTVDSDDGIGVPVGHLRLDEYIPVSVPSGESLFRFPKDVNVPVMVEPGESYFIQAQSYMVDYILFSSLTVKAKEIDPTVGFMEIQLKTLPVK